MKRLETASDLDELLRAARALAVVSAWSQLGLFEALEGGPRPIAELEALHARALETTVPVLLHLGLLVGDGGRIALSPRARALRASGALPGEGGLRALYDASRILEPMRTGAPLDGGTEGGVRLDDPAASARFLDALYARSEDAARLTLEWLAPLLPAGGTVLDVGGGHGRYARTFADAGFPATLFDFPMVVDYARAKHGSALSYLGGDFRDDGAPFGGPYDLVLLSNIVHNEPDESCAALLERLARALRPGGLLVIKDMFLDEQRRDPENAAFFGVTMLLHTRGGRVPSLAATRAWLLAAGLDDVRVTVLDTFQLVRATKPAG